jgi:hypothetical protein
LFITADGVLQDGQQARGVGLAVVGGEEVVEVLLGGDGEFAAGGEGLDLDGGGGKGLRLAAGLGCDFDGCGLVVGVVGNAPAVCGEAEGSGGLRLELFELGERREWVEAGVACELDVEGDAGLAEEVGGGGAGGDDSDADALTGIEQSEVVGRADEVEGVGPLGGDDGVGDDEEIGLDFGGGRSGDGRRYRSGGGLAEGGGWERKQWWRWCGRERFSFGKCR